jgi:hypothetical protein
MNEIRDDPMIPYISEKGKRLPPSVTPGQPNVEAGAVTSNLSDK